MFQEFGGLIRGSPRAWSPKSHWKRFGRVFWLGRPLHHEARSLLVMFSSLQALLFLDTPSSHTSRC